MVGINRTPKGPNPVPSEWITADPVPNLRWRLAINPWPDGQPVENNPSTLAYSSDLLVSQGNPNWQNRLGGSSAVGGDFHVLKREYQNVSTLGTAPRDFSASYTNPSAPGDHARAIQVAYEDRVSNSTFPSITATKRSDLLAMGRRAISLMAPTRSSFDGATFLGELREGLPRAIGFSQTGRERTRVAKAAGSEYLNVEFGWKPLLSDAKGFASTVRNANRIWEQYERNSGKLLKRSFRYPDERSTTHSSTSRQARPVLLSTNYNNFTGNGRMETTTTKTRKVWVEAAFKYYVPKSGLARFQSRANKLYGTNLDPDTLWNLSPWSWAIDWVTDAGVLMENISLFQTDGLVMPYCYLMEEIIHEKQYTWTGSVYRSYPGSQVHTQRFRTTSKRRVVASPYGFDITWDGLSSRQLAILAAVGITRR